MSKKRYYLCVMLVCVAALLVNVTALAQSGGGYDLSWSTIDGGGGSSSGGSYTLDATIGQPDAGALTGGAYALTGGFWGGTAVQYRIYLPLVLRGM